MRAPISTHEFRGAYREAAEAVISLATSETSAAPMSGRAALGPWFAIPASPDSLNLRGYLAACETLYVEALELSGRWDGVELEPPCVLDAGGSFGAFSLALASLGVRVSSCEPMSALEGGAVAVRHALEEVSVDVYPADRESHDDAVDGSFDLMVCLALRPDLGFPDKVMAAASGLVKSQGELVLAVANARYWPRRLHELRRRTAPKAATDTIPLDSARFTEGRLRTLLRDSDLQVRSVRACNCSPRGLGGPRQQLASDLVMRVFASRREVLLASASPGGSR